MSVWYVCDEGCEPIGPVSTELIQRGVVSGKVPLSARVCRHGAEQWLALDQVPEFLDAVAKARVAIDPDAAGSMPDTEGWFVKAAENVIGPVSGGRIARGVEAGLVPSDARVSKHRDSRPDEWEPLQAVPEVAALPAPRASSPSHAALVNSTPAPRGIGTVVLRGLLYGLIGAVFVFFGMMMLGRWIAKRRPPASAAHGAATSSLSDPLWSPCFGKVLSPSGTDPPVGEWLVQECPPARWTWTRTSPDQVMLVLKGLPRERMSERVPDYVRGLLPNLPAPDVSLASTGRGAFVVPPESDFDVDSRVPSRIHEQRLAALIRAVRLFSEAGQAATRIAIMGGQRKAWWFLPAGTVSVDHGTSEELGTVTLKLTTGKTEVVAEPGYTMAPWKPGPPVTLPWPEPVRWLDREMAQDGWWPGDAEAFMSAAVLVGREVSMATAQSLRVISRWLRTSDQWGEVSRLVYVECIRPELMKFLSDPSRYAADFSGFQGAEAKWVVNIKSMDPVVTAMTMGEALPGTIGSPLHAECTMRMTSGAVGTDARGAPVSKQITGPGAEGARALIGEYGFPPALREEMRKARIALLSFPAK